MASALTRTPSATPSDTPSTSARLPISCISTTSNRNPSSSSSLATTDPRLNRRLASQPVRGSPAAMDMPPPPPPSASGSGNGGFGGFASSSSADASRNAFTTAAASAGSVPAFAAPVAAPVAGSPSGAAAAAGPVVGPSRTGDVIDLTSSSPPSSHRPLVPAAQRSGLVFPGSSSSFAAVGPNNAGASTSGAAGPSSRSTQPAGTASASTRRRTRSSIGGSLVLGDSDDDDDMEYVARPTRSRASAARRARAQDDDDDSEIEIVSERPAQPVPPPARGIRFDVHSPPPFIAPSGSTATSSAAGPSGRRRSSRISSLPSASASASSSTAQSNRVPAASTYDDDPDAALARRLAAEDAEEAYRGHGYYGLSTENSYLAAQARALEAARDTPPVGFAGSSRYRGQGSGFGGVFGGGAGGEATGGGRGWSGRDALLQALTGQGMFASLLGGGFWNGGNTLAGMYGGGAGGVGGYPAAGPSGGWGGAAKVKAASKKYGVRMSHPVAVERGFARDIVEPPDEDAPPPVKKAKGKGKAKEPEEDQVPVCASCLDPLFLGGEGGRKVFALKCGHVVCAKCLDEAKARARVELGVSGGKAAKGKGKDKAKAASSAKSKSKAKKGKSKAAIAAYSAFAASDDSDDDDYFGDDFDPFELDRLDGGPLDLSAPSSDDEPLSVSTSRGAKKDKGKAKSRADETGVEEGWTSCPVSTCDGRGTEVLAEEGYNRPYELFV